MYKQTSAVQVTPGCGFVASCPHRLLSCMWQGLPRSAHGGCHWQLPPAVQDVCFASLSSTQGCTCNRSQVMLLSTVPQGNTLGGKLPTIGFLSTVCRKCTDTDIQRIFAVPLQQCISRVTALLQGVNYSQATCQACVDAGHVVPCCRTKAWVLSC